MLPTFAARSPNVKAFLHIFLFICFSVSVFSQDSTSFFAPARKFSKPRFASVAGIQAVGYGGSLALLSKAWYQGHPQTSFHTFNDGQEWLQVDKAGHFVTSYYLGRIGIDLLHWSGVKDTRSALYGCTGSILYLTGIEVMDGFSDGWGFSWRDFGVNVLGAGFASGQALLATRENNTGFVRGITGTSFKFSFHTTGWAELRPSLLGATLPENMLKDYNGQSYWMSFNLASFLNKGTKFPKWLNVAVGYGGEGMISGHPEFVDIEGGNTIFVERYRQYYLSLDIDLTRIKTSSHFLKTVFEAISFIKIPAPAMEMSNGGIKFHPFYY